MTFKTDLCCSTAWDALVFGTGTCSEWNVFSSAGMLWSYPCVDSAFMQDLHLFASVVVYFPGLRMRAIFNCHLDAKIYI